MSLGYLFNIRAKTIKLKQPILIEGSFKRTSFNSEKPEDRLIGWEAELRKTAYQNSNIRTGDSFFNDSDMKSEYFLVVVYDKKMEIPLLSARYYFNKEVIQKSLDGDSDSEYKPVITIPRIDLSQFENGKIFIADRLSGNTEHSIYKKYRRFIFSKHPLVLVLAQR